MGAKVSHSILDLFILSLLDRGLETSYDLHIHGGLSLGSTIPALRRLETAGLVRKKDPAGSSRRPRHWYQLSAAGRKLAKNGWITLLKDRPPGDFDAVLRLADLAAHYERKPADIAQLLERASKDRILSSKQASAGKNQDGLASLLYVVTSNGWDASRLAAEAQFLSRLAKSVSTVPPKKLKTR
jgi:DNA-binding PadR family transcriptional regulator